MPKGTRVFRGERLKTAREKLELKQDDFIDIGVQQAQISRYESGSHEPSPELIVKLAIKLNVSTDYLLGLSDESNRSSSVDELSDDERELLALVARIGVKRVKALFDT